MKINANQTILKIELRVQKILMELINKREYAEAY
jgi:hypothetical protein